MKQVDFHRKGSPPLQFLAPRAMASGIAIIIGLFVATRNPFVGNFLGRKYRKSEEYEDIERNECLFGVLRTYLEKRGEEKSGSN
jgi:hypothetical protein